jgi:glycosyltransferase involved in cell wall biosynthesis
MRSPGSKQTLVRESKTHKLPDGGRSFMSQMNHNGNAEPLVSVIIPTYNCGKFIEQSIESVFKQTYKNREIIVVDDGSTDDTPLKMSKYRENIVYIRQNNQGSSKARNVGMGYSKGEYLGFLDADDRWHPRKLEMQIECFQKVHDIGMVFTDFSRIDMEDNIVQDRYERYAFAVFQDYGLRINKIFKGKRMIRIADSNQDFSQHILYFGDVFYHLCKGNFILPSTTLFKKKCIEKIGLLWNEEFQCAQDQYFHLHFAHHFPVAYLDAVTADYRIGRGDSLSGNKNTPQLIINTIRTIEDIYKRDDDFRFSKKALFKTILGKHYARLAYYYLSELDRVNAKKYSLFSMKYKPLHFKSISTLFLSFSPLCILENLKKYKKKVHGVGL